MTRVLARRGRPGRNPAMRAEPHRLFFLLGLLFSLSGAALWPLHALGALPYPGPLHRALMIEGFELCFISGFLLTALAGLTHGARWRPAEMWTAFGGALLFALASLAARPAPALGGFLLTVGTLAVAVARRVRAAPAAAPREMLLVLLGLLAGLAGGGWQLAAMLQGVGEPQPGFGLRLVSHGMVLLLVLGVGGLLVPTFTGTRDPLRIPGIAGPHQPRGRVILYGVLAALFVLSFVAEAGGRRTTGALLRAPGATVLLLLVWKLQRLPVRRTTHAWALWSAGVFVLLGLWIAALLPLHPLAGDHVVLIGGFGLLSMGIGSRVTVAHGGHPLPVEDRLMNPVPFALLVLAVAVRLVADFAGAGATPWLGLAGLLWTLAWLAWGVRAVPLLAGPRPERQPPPAPVPLR